MSRSQPIPSSNEDVPWWIRLCRWLWKHPLPFLWGTLLVNVVINIGSSWLITPATSQAIPGTSIVGRIAEWTRYHWLFSLLLGTISAALLLVTWLGSRWPESPPAPRSQTTMSPQDRARILGRLHVRYEQLLAQSLQNAVRIELGLASRPAAIQNATSLALHLPVPPDQLLPPQTSILDVYEQVHQELLILGEPGAGKSTLLLELAYHLVEQAEKDTQPPLPVLVPLSTWASKRLPLHEWLIEQIAWLYNVPRRLSRQWVETEQVLPLLDGLDELEEAARPACVRAINAYHREHMQPLVVCSRTFEYEQAITQEQLALNTAVVVLPISLKQVNAYLEKLGVSHTALHTALNKNAVLAELATTPLMVQILLLTYHGTTAWELPQKKKNFQQQIWTDYVQHMIERKGDTKRYPLDCTIRWLGWLAKVMRDHNQSIFSLERLQPNSLPKTYRTLYQGSVVWPVILLFGMVVGLLSWRLARDYWLLGSLLGLLFGLFVGLDPRWKSEIEPAESLIWSIWSQAHVLPRRVIGIVILLLAIVILGILGNVIEELTKTTVFAILTFGSIGGLLFVILVRLISKYSRKQLTERLMLSPNEGIHRSVKNGLVVGLVAGLVIGIAGRLLVGLLYGLISRPLIESLDEPLSWLLFGLVVGVVVGLYFGLGAALQHYTLRFWLWRSGLFPLQAVPFLEDATARNLLRRVGGGYSFTHQLLLEYLADLDPSSPTPSPDDQSPTQTPPS